MLKKGTIGEHEKLLLGPFESGAFVPVEVQTVQRYRVPCRIARAGQSASLSIGNPDNLHEKLRKVRAIRLFIVFTFLLIKLLC
jgi:GTPase